MADEKLTCSGTPCHTVPLQATIARQAKSWASRYRDNRQRVLDSHSRAVAALQAECSSHSALAAGVLCASCEATFETLEAGFRSALRECKQRVYRATSMWRKRHAACKRCGYVPVMPAVPWEIRAHRTRTAAEVLSNDRGTGALLGRAAHNALSAASS